MREHRDFYFKFRNLLKPAKFSFENIHLEFLFFDAIYNFLAFSIQHSAFSIQHSASIYQ